MSFFFGPFHNLLSKLTLLFVVGSLVLSGGVAFALYRSYYVTGTNEPLTQPVAFSHKHHVGELGIDCRYCHTSVETSANAGMPPTHTCMTCHSQIWLTSSLLQPVRDSYQKDQPLAWSRVYRLPDFVYFNHSIHVNKGIGCSTCHGAVDEMPITRQHKAFLMRQCVACHRNPENFLRPSNAIFDMHWAPAENQNVVGAQLAQYYKTPKYRLTDCTTCHR